MRPPSYQSAYTGIATTIRRLWWRLRNVYDVHRGPLRLGRWDGLEGGMMRVLSVISQLVILLGVLCFPLAEFWGTRDNSIVFTPSDLKDVTWKAGVFLIILGLLSLHIS